MDSITCKNCGKFGHKEELCFKDKKTCSFCNFRKNLEIQKYGKTRITIFTLFSHNDLNCPNICHWCYENKKYCGIELPFTHTTVTCKNKDNNISLNEQFEIFKKCCSKLNTLNLEISKKYIQ